MRGAEVVELQNCLNSINYNVGYADGIFGHMTLAGVKAFQTDHSLTPDGVVGPMTGAALETACNGSTTTTTTTTGSSNEALCPNGNTIASNCTVAPGEDEFTISDDAEEGDISSLEAEAADGADELARDKDHQKAWVVTVEADEDGSDIQVKRMDLTFSVTPADTGTEDDLYDIFDKFTVEVDGDEIISKETDDDSDWRGSDDDTLRLSGLDTVVKAGEEKEFVVYVDTADLDLSDIENSGGTQNLEVTLTDVAVRFIDEAGYSDEASVSSLSETATIKPLDSFDVDLSEADANEDVAKTLNLKNDVSKETIFAADVEVEDNQGGTIEEVEVSIDIDPIAAGNVDDIIKRVYVYIDGSKVDDDKTADTNTMAATNATYTYNLDLDDFDVDAGDEFELEVKVDFEALPSGQEGTKVKVTGLTFNGEDEEGDDFSVAKTPSFAQEVILSSGALVAESVSVDGYDKVGGSDALAKASYTIELKADGDDDVTLDHITFDIDGTSTDITNAASGSVTVNGVDYTVEIKEDDDDGADISTLAGYAINSGESKTIYVEFTAEATANNVEEIELELTSVQYDISGGTANNTLLIEKDADSTVVEL